jgi:branched-chain amino acid transport system permease protein
MSFGPHLFLALLEGTVTAFVLALTALGLSLVFGVMRIVNVAHGEFFMLGAVLAWVLREPRRIAARRFPVRADRRAARGRRDRARCRPARCCAASTITPRARSWRRSGCSTSCQQAVLTLYGPDARPVPAPVSFTLQFPWFGYSGYKLVVAAISAALLAATWWLLAHTRLGLYMRAAQQDLEMAQAFGVRRGASTRSCSRWARCSPPPRACSSCRSSRRTT